MKNLKVSFFISTFLAFSKRRFIGSTKEINVRPPTFARASLLRIKPITTEVLYAPNNEQKTFLSKCDKLILTNIKLLYVVGTLMPLVALMFDTTYSMLINYTRLISSYCEVCAL